MACAAAAPDKFAAVCVVDPRLPGSEQRLAHWFKLGCRGLRVRPRIEAEEAVFGHPDTFDVDRTSNRHVGFGAGPHLCLGLGLARMEFIARTAYLW